eukprot:3836842-Amphidinium_carterae.1
MEIRMSIGPGESGNRGGPKAKEAEAQCTQFGRGRMFKDLKLRGRALAGVVIASLTTNAEAVSEMTSTQVEPTTESCLAPSSQVEYCSQDAVLQRAVEIVQRRTHMMWVSDSVVFPLCCYDVLGILPRLVL